MKQTKQLFGDAGHKGFRRVETKQMKQMISNQTKQMKQTNNALLVFVSLKVHTSSQKFHQIDNSAFVKHFIIAPFETITSSLFIVLKFIFKNSPFIFV